MNQAPNDLLEAIYTAQLDAGERVVIAHLRSQGLIDSEPNQPTAGTESAQSATKDVAPPLPGQWWEAHQGYYAGTTSTSAFAFAPSADHFFNPSIF